MADVGFELSYVDKKWAMKATHKDKRRVTEKEMEQGDHQKNIRNTGLCPLE